MTVRPLRAEDRQQWQPLWDGYNLFYERPNLPPEITEAAWTRFLDERERMHAAVAELDGRIVGIVHYLYHRSTTSVEDVCYLQDLFTAPEARGLGVARALIEHVYEEAAKSGSRRVYWQTHEANPARKLYDRVAGLTPFRRYLKELA
ncbi:MAG TPA: GNAT family N-acetyltransferase [Sphingomicrobium sp.]|nr:GNAT family N-acetyltransferase [Sphingomicrobium sp.]